MPEDEHQRNLERDSVGVGVGCREVSEVKVLEGEGSKERRKDADKNGGSKGKDELHWKMRHRVVLLRLVQLSVSI